MMDPQATPDAAARGRVGAALPKKQKKPLTTGRLMAYIIFGSGALFALWVAVIAVIGVTFGKDIAEGMSELTKKAKEVGAARGTSGCVEEGLARVEKCNRFNMKCRVAAQMFQDQCLQVSADAEQFCEGAPAPLDISDAMTYRHEACKHLPTERQEPCGQLAQSQLMFCEMRSKAISRAAPEAPPTNQ